MATNSSKPKIKISKVSILALIFILTSALLSIILFVQIADQQKKLNIHTLSSEIGFIHIDKSNANDAAYLADSELSYMPEQRFRDFGVKSITVNNANDN